MTIIKEKVRAACGLNTVPGVKYGLGKHKDSRVFFPDHLAMVQNPYRITTATADSEAALVLLLATRHHCDRLWFTVDAHSYLAKSRLVPTTPIIRKELTLGKHSLSAPT